MFGYSLLFLISAVINYCITIDGSNTGCVIGYTPIIYSANSSSFLFDSGTISFLVINDEDHKFTLPLDVFNDARCTIKVTSPSHGYVIIDYPSSLLFPIAFYDISLYLGPKMKDKPMKGDSINLLNSYAPFEFFFNDVTLSGHSISHTGRINAAILNLLDIPEGSHFRKDLFPFEEDNDEIAITIKYSLAKSSITLGNDNIEILGENFSFFLNIIGSKEAPFRSLTLSSDLADNISLNLQTKFDGIYESTKWKEINFFYSMSVSLLINSSFERLRFSTLLSPILSIDSQISRPTSIFAEMITASKVSLLSSFVSFFAPLISTGRTVDGIGHGYDTSSFSLPTPIEMNVNNIAFNPLIQSIDVNLFSIFPLSLHFNSNPFPPNQTVFFNILGSGYSSSEDNTYYNNPMSLIVIKDTKFLCSSFDIRPDPTNLVIANGFSNEKWSFAKYCEINNGSYHIGAKMTTKTGDFVVVINIMTDPDNTVQSQINSVSKGISDIHIKILTTIAPKNLSFANISKKANVYIYSHVSVSQITLFGLDKIQKLHVLNLNLFFDPPNNDTFIESVYLDNSTMSGLSGNLDISKFGIISVSSILDFSNILIKNPKSLNIRTIDIIAILFGSSDYIIHTSTFSYHIPISISLSLSCANPITANVSRIHSNPKAINLSIPSSSKLIFDESWEGYKQLALRIESVNGDITIITNSSNLPVSFIPDSSRNYNFFIELTSENGIKQVSIPEGIVIPKDTIGSFSFSVGSFLPSTISLSLKIPFAQIHCAGILQAGVQSSRVDIVLFDSNNYITIDDLFIDGEVEINSINVTRMVKIESGYITCHSGVFHNAVYEIFIPIDVTGLYGIVQGQPVTNPIFDVRFRSIVFIHEDPKLLILLPRRYFANGIPFLFVPPSFHHIVNTTQILHNPPNIYTEAGFIHGYQKLNSQNLWMVYREIGNPVIPPPASTKEKELSTGQIVGIIGGGSAAVGVSVTGVVYFVLKRAAPKIEDIVGDSSSNSRSHSSGKHKE